MTANVSRQVQYSGMPLAVKENQMFGDWLVQNGYITEQQLAAALNDQKTSGGRLGQNLVRLAYLNDEQLTQCLAAYLNLESISLSDLSVINKEVARRIPENIAKRFHSLAVDAKDDRILVAMADPLNVIAVDTVSVKLKKNIQVVLASEREIQRAIEYVYHGTDVEEQQLRDLVELEISSDEDDLMENTLAMEVSAAAEAQDAPVIRFVDLLLSQAIKSRASDIHIEPQDKSMSIRMRIDGLLTEMVPPPRKMQPAVIARIKILSEMDIAERRLPQDGRFKIRRGQGKEEIDVRVSSLPTIYGEKIVMRILDKGAVTHNLDSLGLEPDLLAKFKMTLQQPHGIIIVTGPTGSGKSTTLYSALNELRDPHKNITTVEDPVEYRLEGINQTQIKPSIGLTFASCLRTILRQDPDIILIGEIRDKETMEIAIKASLTGHLVLSTFHTNDAPSALSRLVYMGLEPYLLASSLNLILAQRLVRRICDKCKAPQTLTETQIKRLELTPEQIANTTFYHGKGCSECGGSGYRGRLPIFEFLIMDNQIREALANGASESQIRTMIRQKGYGSLLSSGLARAIEGRTTAEEIIRVTYAENIEV
ncbi:MAG TPA: ATPase, T2SS/T4P/T4SS family [Anaerohalosphaeraceae bacterium]|nr:ATPase, T2SS/T4P/T4SS family [Anaerohalosphaeraceae bacterium]HOL30847.1 ATPase, T2SS/T4P/T4SS family [Anaerohalosphaeraceae bacterium]HOM77146.1 ATPase, T2SS/T4P/T4SS family [Anaerohalosphaeraceae bacterium]HPC64896.1 ATPase, T2SS/T4P/T4SS family [Anaerohalosphaeraceae bacterium]HPO69205.1 ATPase, T2SS/T4P/T4SS family [Anaerohalosphaeraceae bacterium]